MTSNASRRVAEFVLPGHPDKVADAIADRIVEAALAKDPITAAGIEVAVHRNLTLVTGCLVGAGTCDIDIPTLVNEVHAEIGASERRADAGRCLLDLDVRNLTRSEVAGRGQAANDQSIATGWATTVPGSDGLPVEHALARRIAIALWRLHVIRPERALGPDGKVIVDLRENEGGFHPRWEIEGVTVSIQHPSGWDEATSRRAVAEAIMTAIDVACHDIPGLSISSAFAPTINPGGSFTVGGTHGDNGLSGKKLVVDHYGPRVAIGGGALSGKDFASVDRAGALIARDLALAVAATFGAQTCEVTLTIRPGDVAFDVARVIADGRTSLDIDELSSRVDLGVGSRLDWPFRNGPLVEVARWGHFAPVPTF
jgi:S-adenosylmethionine synthetase